MTSARRTLIAVAVAAALGLVYGGWVKVLKPRRDQAKEDAKLIFPGTSADALSEILLRKQGNADVRLLRVGGTWSLAQPIQAPADQDQVSGLVAGLVAAKREEIIVDKGADLHEFGLDSPTGAVTFRPASPTAKALALFFGSDNPTGRYTYGMVDGLPAVFMVDQNVKTLSLKTAADLRDKQVWNFDLAQVESVAAPGFTMKRDKGIWSIRSASGLEPAKGQGVTDWLGQVLALRADAVPSEDGKGPYGLASGRSINLGLADGSHLTLLLGARGKPKVPAGARKGTKASPDGIYVQVAGRKPVFHLPENLVAVLQKPAQDLADRNAFLLPSQSVQRFEVSGPGGVLEASQDKGSWGWVSRTAGPGEKAFDFGAFVTKIAGVSLIKRLPLSDKPAKPVRTVRFYDGGNNLIETGDFGPLLNGGQVVFSAGKAAVFLVSKDLLDGLPPLGPLPAAPPLGAGPQPKTAPPPAAAAPAAH
jgi:hypothetical protein